MRELLKILPLILLLACSQKERKEIINTAPTAVAALYIEVEGSEEIALKEYYNATLSIDGAGAYEDVESITTRIKGRGNSTWKHDKKPYKLKLDEKMSLLGYAAEREWVLLANYIDPTLMLNAVAMKAGELLGCEHVNRVVPVELYINGTYRGSYAFTEQVEIKEDRVKIEDGYLLEISTTYGEQWQYRSPIVRMPVMLKDAKCKESDEEIFNSRVIPEFNALEAALFSDDFPNNGYEKLVDLRSVAALYLTNELMLNREVTSPRSLFIFREKGEKFRYGPIWDFDYCSGRYPAFNLEHFATESVESTIFRFSKVDDGVLERVDFSLRYFLDPNFVAIYKEVWSEFYSNKELLFDYMESYATTLEASADANYKLWDSPYGRGFREEYDRMKEWFAARIEHLNDTINNR